MSSIDKILSDSDGYLLCIALSCQMFLLRRWFGGYDRYGIGLIYELLKDGKLGGDKGFFWYLIVWKYQL